MAAVLSTATTEVVHIRPIAGWGAVNLAEFWRYRELLYFQTPRGIKLQYKQTALGVAWALLQPLLTMTVFTILFRQLGGLEKETGGRPYILFVMAALIPWQLFSYALTRSSNSLVAEQRLITKVYFPLLIVPVASVLSGLWIFSSPSA